jgi:hypothetical protein
LATFSLTILIIALRSSGRASIVDLLFEPPSGLLSHVWNRMRVDAQVI